MRTSVSDSKRTRCLLFLLVFLALIAAAWIAARGAGRWLIREDSLGPADVIVVLSGGMPYRADEAARLFRAHEAPEVWISQPESPAAELEPRGIHYVGEEEYDRQILVHGGVPETAIHTLFRPSVDTEEEVQEIAREMHRAGKAKAIIVTSPQHTRRVRVLWKKLVGANPPAIVCAASVDPFDADHWWRTTRDALAVVREFLGLLNAEAGFPVRPRRR